VKQINKVTYRAGFLKVVGAIAAAAFGRCLAGFSSLLPLENFWTL